MTDTDLALVPQYAAPPPPGASVLRLQGITKTFPGVRALTAVDLDVVAGEIHALVGENGAGKSTLMAVASGALAPDEGVVSIDGHDLTSADPDEARRLGLGIVRQDPALLPDLTVAENMAVGVGYRRVGGLGRAVRWSAAQLEPWGMGIDPRARVADLSVEQRFIVEIAKALSLEPRVLILDEPTEHLSIEEVQKLFARVREVAAGGAAVVYISHRIPEVKQISDRITVLRDGKVRGTFLSGDVDEAQIIERVIGRKLEAVFPEKGSVAGTIGDEERLVVRDLRGDGFHDVSLSVREGEIIGLAGVQGNGQAALIRALAGQNSPSSGVVEVDGRAVGRGAPAGASAGVVYVPADRHREGVFLPLSVAENVSSATLPAVSPGGFVSDRRMQSRARDMISRLAIKTPSPRTHVASLSGGNQQKVVLARTLLAKPRVLLAEEPTQGVDAGARVDIYRILREAADGGAAVVVLSSDGVELEGLCDRVLILSRGEVVRELVGDEVTESEIARAALTSTSVRERDDQAGGRHRLRSWLRGDHAPAVALAAVFLGLGLAVAATNPAYFSAFNINNLLFMVAPLLFVGAAQQVVVLGSGFDLSIGPLMGFLVVLASFWIVDGGNLYVGLGLMLAGAVGVGVINGVLVTRFAISPVVATLAMFMALQGAYLLLRSTPGGIIFPGVSDMIQARVGIIPVVTIVGVVVLVGLEIALRRTRWGVELRAVGSQDAAAARLGIRVGWVRFFSYVLCSLLVLPAAVVLMAQIGIGDGRPSVSYTLSSVTVVVLAGTSIFGGRGSFVAVLAAAFLVQQILNVSPFLGLSQAWSYWLPGLVTLAAAALYAALRGGGRRRRRPAAIASPGGAA